VATQECLDKADLTLDKLLRDIDLLEGLVASWDEQQRNGVRALLLAVDALHKEAFVRLIRTLKRRPDMVEALQEAASDDVVYAVLRHFQILKPSLHERVEMALASVRPFLTGHGGDVELVSVEPPSTVTIRLRGACSSCPASELTLSEGVEKAIKEHCPEIVEIKRAKSLKSEARSDGTQVHFVSPFASTGEAGRSGPGTTKLQLG
jgi:Fe-S cluster biogenesis protein NfuA